MRLKVNAAWKVGVVFMVMMAEAVADRPVMRSPQDYMAACELIVQGQMTEELAGTPADQAQLTEGPRRRAFRVHQVLWGNELMTGNRERLKAGALSPTTEIIILYPALVKDDSNEEGLAEEMVLRNRRFPLTAHQWVWALKWSDPDNAYVSFAKPREGFFVTYNWQERYQHYRRADDFLKVWWDFKLAQDAAQRSPLGLAWTEGPSSLTVAAVRLSASAAAEAGLLPGDVLFTVNEQSLTTLPDWEVSVSGKEAGAKIRLTLSRKGATVSATVVLPDHWNESPAGSPVPVPFRNALARPTLVVRGPSDGDAAKLMEVVRGELLRQGLTEGDFALLAIHRVHGSFESPAPPLPEEIFYTVEFESQRLGGFPIRGQRMSMKVLLRESQVKVVSGTWYRQSQVDLHPVTSFAQARDTIAKRFPTAHWNPRTLSIVDATPVENPPKEFTLKDKASLALRWGTVYVWSRPPNKETDGTYEVDAHSGELIKVR